MTTPNGLTVRLANAVMTIETKDTTNGISKNLPTITTTKINFPPSVFPNFFMAIADNNGLTNSRSLYFKYENNDLSFDGYSERYVTEEGNEFTFSYTTLESSVSFDHTETSPGKHEFAITAFKVLAKETRSGETREITGRGYAFVRYVDRGWRTSS